MAAERLLHKAVRRAPLPNAASFVLKLSATASRLLLSNRTDELHLVTMLLAVFTPLWLSPGMASVLKDASENTTDAHKNKVISPIDAVAAAI